MELLSHSFNRIYFVELQSVPRLGHSTLEVSFYFLLLSLCRLATVILWMILKSTFKTTLITWIVYPWQVSFQQKTACLLSYILKQNAIANIAASCHAKNCQERQYSLLRNVTYIGRVFVISYILAATADQLETRLLSRGLFWHSEWFGIFTVSEGSQWVSNPSSVHTRH